MGLETSPVEKVRDGNLTSKKVTFETGTFSHTSELHSEFSLGGCQRHI